MPEEDGVAAKSGEGLSRATKMHMAELTRVRTTVTITYTHELDNANENRTQAEGA